MARAHGRRGSSSLSGGVFRHAEDVDAAVARIAADAGGAGSVLAGSDVVVDRQYVLAAAGLLAAEHPTAAGRLVARLVS